MRLPRMGILITRPICLLVLVPSLIFLHLVWSSTSSADYARASRGVDARVEWSEKVYGTPSNTGDDWKGSNLVAGIGSRIGRLTGAKGSGPSQPGWSNLFRRTGGSIHELVDINPTTLYDARTSLDKLRLTSARFSGANAPSPYSVFAHSPERQHILVTGGFTPLGKALVRDLLLLGDDSGSQAASEVGSAASRFNFKKLWGSPDSDGEGAHESAYSWSKVGGGSKDLEGKTGIVVTVVDAGDRSAELDDILKHPPLYHRSKVGFDLPTRDSRTPPASSWGSSNGDTPPLEFVDPRSAAFSSSEVSLASFIERGRLRIIRSDARNATLLAQLLVPSLANPTEPQLNHADEKARFRKPHHHQDEGAALPPITGIFHLAGYENSECIKHKRDCADLERNGVSALAKALQQTNPDSRPWVVMGNRGNLDNEEVAVWLQHSDQAADAAAGQIMTAETSLPAVPAVNVMPTRRARSKRDYKPTSDYGNPLSELARKEKIHAISLQLPPDHHIYGDAFASRSLPIPHLVHSAIGHLPISIDPTFFPAMAVAPGLTSDPSETKNDAQPRTPWSFTGLAYIEDVVETVLAAGELLARSNRLDYLSRLSILADIEVAPPHPTASLGRSLAEDTVDWIVQLTKSSSPVGYIHAADIYAGDASDAVRFRDPGLAKRVLGTSPSTPLPLGLKAYIRNVLGRQTTYLLNRIGNACAPPPDLPTLNEALAQLDTCSVQLLGMISAENMVLACNPAYETDKTAAPLVLSKPIPDQGGLSEVKLAAHWGPVGRVDVSLYCPFGPGGADEQIVWLENMAVMDKKWATTSVAAAAAARDATYWIYDTFEANFIRRDTRSFTLSVPQYPQANPESPKRRMVFFLDYQRKRSNSTFKDLADFEFQLLAETGPDWQTMEWRINPICCEGFDVPLTNGFSFMTEDPLLTSQVLYPSGDGSTSIAESTYETQVCRELRSSNEYMKRIDTWNERTLTDQTCPRSLSEGSDWVIQDLPACNVDCEAPMTCFVTDKCRCTRDRCEEEAEQDPQHSEILAYSDSLSCQYTGSDEAAAGKGRTSAASLSERVQALPWDAVIQPSARHLMSLPLDRMPRGHLVSLPAEVDSHLSDRGCYALDTKARVSPIADHLLVTAFANRSVAAEDADFALVPYFQGCYHDYLHENTYRKLADTIASAESQIVISEKLHASNVVVPFTHDWGSCTGSWFQHEDVLARTPPPPMSKAVSWQTNGDLSTRCIKPERDIIIPPVSRNTETLVKKYGDFARVTLSSKRKQLAFYNGKIEGLGALARSRLAGLDGRDGIVYQVSEEQADYIAYIGNSRFCLLPRGITGWTPHLVDAIYAGCIPVYLADRTAVPFSGILSYSAFSVTVPENMIHTLYDVLSAFSDEETDLMQVALLKIREAFVYRINDPDSEWHRRGPLYYTLLEMAQKTSLEWPTLATHDTCRNRQIAT